MAEVRRGDLLLEVLVALAVFVVGAALLLATARETLAALERSERRERALDLARSALARLETGVINLQDLRSGRVDGEDVGAWGDEGFSLELRSRRSEWPGLSLVELVVRDKGARSEEPALCTLRQLVALRAGDEPSDDDFSEASPR